MGSKRRIATSLSDIIMKDVVKSNGFIETMCGGLNLTDKIFHENIICYDNNKYLIALYKFLQKYNIPPSMREVTYEQYIRVQRNKNLYYDWYVGLVGFCASYGGKFFGGYARHYKGDDSGSIAKGSIENLIKQKETICRVKNFICCDYYNINPKEYNGYVFYNDPPYKDTTKYSTGFDYEKYYNWCRELSKNNIVYCSEYWMPEDFEIVWQEELRSVLHRKEDFKTSEKLYKIGELNCH